MKRKCHIAKLFPAKIISTKILHLVDNGVIMLCLHHLSINGYNSVICHFPFDYTAPPFLAAEINNCKF